MQISPSLEFNKLLASPQLSVLFITNFVFLDFSSFLVSFSFSLEKIFWSFNKKVFKAFRAEDKLHISSSFSFKSLSKSLLVSIEKDLFFSSFTLDKKDILLSNNFCNFKIKLSFSFVKTSWYSLNNEETFFPFSCNLSWTDLIFYLNHPQHSF